MDRGIRDDFVPCDSPRRPQPSIDRRRSRRRRNPACFGRWRHVHHSCVGGGDGRALIASSTCSCRTAAVRPRTVTISRRCSHFCRESSNSPSAARTQVVRAGSTVNIPANASHAFKNVSGKTARMLCLCAPAGQEELSWPLAFPSTAAPRRRKSAPKRRPRRASCLRPWRPNIGPKSSLIDNLRGARPLFDGAPDRVSRARFGKCVKSRRRAHRKLGLGPARLARPTRTIRTPTGRIKNLAQSRTPAPAPTPKHGHDWIARTSADRSPKPDISRSPARAAQHPRPSRGR